MELARKDGVRGETARGAERQQLLAAVKFMGLTPPPAEEPSPDWIARLRSFLFRAAGRLRAARS